MSELPVCSHEFFVRKHKKCDCEQTFRRTWDTRQVFYHENVIGPDTRFTEWLELVDTTQPGATHRTYKAGRTFARLVVPVPMWLACRLIAWGVM